MIHCRCEPKVPVSVLLYLKHITVSITVCVLGMAHVLFTLKAYFTNIWNTKQ